METLFVVRPYRDRTETRKLAQEATTDMMTIIRRIVKVVLSWILKKV